MRSDELQRFGAARQPRLEVNRVKNIWRLALAAVMAFASMTASADVIVNFQLQDFTFQSGAIATGTFTLDETLQSTTAVDILYSGNPALAGGYHFTDSTLAGSGCFESGDMGGLGFCNVGSNFQTLLALRFADPLGTGADAIDTGPSVFRDVGQIFINDEVTSGSVVPASVPEPETLSLMAAGFVLLAFARRTLR